METSRIIWSDGLVLNHQLFQLQDMVHEQRLALSTRSLHAYPCGVQRCVALNADHEVDRAELMVLEAVLPCGTLVRAPDADELPLALPFGRVAPDIDSLLVAVTLPPWRRDGGNCPDTDRRDTRYTPREALTPDMYGDGPKVPIHFARLRPQLVIVTSERPEPDALPIARYLRGPGGGFLFDRTYIAPALSVSECAPVQDRLTHLLKAMHGKIATLTAEQAEPVRDSVAYRAGDHATFWLLHTLGAGAASLMHLKELPIVAPERLFQEMLRLAGGLQAFRRTEEQRRLPTYDHMQANACFGLLFNLVTHLIDTVIPTRFIAIPLNEERTSYFVGTLDAELIDANAMLCLALHSDPSDADLVTTVPRRFKLGTADDVEKAVNSALPCVPLKHLPHPPPAVPVKPDHLYFALDRTSVTCKRMLEGKTLTLFVPDGLPKLRMELLAVHE